jgi:mono/diheme cytochrome c family protein
MPTLKQQHNLSVKSASLITGLLCLYLSSAAQVVVGQTVTYEVLAPTLAGKCIMCHSGTNAAAGLSLDSYDALLKGSAKGPVVKAGDPAASELIRRLKGSSQPRMPMTGPPFLSDNEITLFENWITNGMQRGAIAQVEKPASVQPARPGPGEPVSWQHVAPIFATRCAKCHTDGGQMGNAPEGYRLNSYSATLAATDRVRVVPGQPKASELVRRIRGQAKPRMPFDGPPYLTGDEIKLIEDWVAQGARNAQGQPATVPVGARVRLHGTLEPGWQLDGLSLIVGSGTRIDKSPAPGNYVQVRGRVDNTGNIVVDRLRRR